MSNSRLTRDDLLQTFLTAGKPREKWRVGAELERHLLRPDSGMPVPYSGEYGVRWLIERMSSPSTAPAGRAPPGWKVKREGDNPIALERPDGSSITLEPGSQYEFSTAPFPSVEGVDRQAREFVHAAEKAIGDAPLVMVALGYTPFALVDQIQWVPKGRYVVMREHLGHTGPLAHHMMKSTCAVQASFDFADEEDCARKVRLGTLMGPLTTATFANSPLTGGQPNGWMTFRGHVWTQTDPRRTGFPEAAERFRFDAWVDYLLDVPMMFLHDDAHGWRPAHGRSFREWMEKGIDGAFPDDDAWQLHLTSVFPEVRVKRLIEIRGADCVSHPLAMAFCAFFEGLLYDDRALADATAVVERMSAHGTSRERFDVACREGLAGRVGGRRYADWAGDLVQIAAEGLARLDKGDSHFLAPLEAQVARGVSPAHDVLEHWKHDPRPQAMVEALRYRA
jgi:glutamate--cysteine ligase